MTFEELKTRLRNVQEHGPNRITASCPCGSNHSHDDKNRSFSASYDSKTRKILVKCYTGCSYEDICASLGCGKADLMPEITEQERQHNFLEWYAGENALILEAVYSYCYGAFDDGLAKIRFRKSDGSKDFRWIKTDNSTKSGFRLTREGCPHRLYVRGDQQDNKWFIVEGEKDADTLHTLTHCTAASAENGATKGSSAGGKWLDEYSQQLAGKDVYILWDNDTAGRNFAKIEAQALEGHAARMFMLDITKMWPECPEKGDITDMVQALGDSETLARLHDLIQATPERPLQAVQPAEAEQSTEVQETPQPATAPTKGPVELFNSFMDKVQTDAYKPIATGMQGFDRLLRGGIPRQSLVILSAAPGTGKTTLAQQIFEAAAAHGTDVIFLNLEMSREQLLARSISRLIHRDGGNITASEVMRGYSWTDTQRKFIETAAARYRAEIAPRMQYNPENCGTGLSSIMETLNNAADSAHNAGKPAPVCVLDYLHLVTAEQREEQQELIKKTVAALKGWAIAHNTYVFAISASNRAANSSGIQAQDSARDSSSIEYTADIQLSLNYRDLHEGKADAKKPDDMERLQRERPRHMMIQVLKNRMNEPGGKLYLSFDAANSIFIEEVDLQKMGFKEVTDPDLPDF